MKIEKYLPAIKKKVPLAKYTTFKIGGPARYFYIAKNKDDLIKGIKAAKKFNLPFFVLGRGSNVLFSDEGFNGLVIKIKSSMMKTNNSEIFAEAGLRLDDLVKISAEKSLKGIEWAAGIPGTVGGAIYGNVQAFGKKISDIVKQVEVLDAKTLNIKNLTKKQCLFSDKKSIFKKKRNLIILSAILKLKKGDKKKIKKKIKDNLALRKKRHPLKFPSAGSIFINQPGFPPSAFLIERAGLKGTRIGGAKISEKHAGFIINLGKAKAKDVKSLIKLIKEKIKKKFGVVLKEEIQIIGVDKLSRNEKIK